MGSSKKAKLYAKVRGCVKLLLTQTLPSDKQAKYVK